LAENDEIDIRRSESTRRKQKAKKEQRKAVIFINGVNWFVVFENWCVFAYAAGTSGVVYLNKNKSLA
jgi:hypothetical protein